MATGSGCCYILIYQKMRKQRQLVLRQHQQRQQRQRQITELKLMLAGVILFLLTCIYAVFCGTIAMVKDDANMLLTMITFQSLMGDAYSWANPYLLLMCSSTLRRHMKALVTCSKNVVEPTVQATTKRFGPSSVRQRRVE